MFYKTFRYLIILLISAILLVSCQSVKPYQKAYLNDHFMKMEKRSVQGFGEKALTYREGSSGGGAGKSSGGCGCN